MIKLADQAERLREMARSQGESQQNARVIVITSGKGGVGKTNVAANLGICLAAAGQRVLLVDADLGLANVDVLLDVKPRFHLGHLLAGRCSISDAILKGPAGMRLLAGASGLRQLANLSQFERCQLLGALSDCERDFDLILIDTGAGLSHNVTTLCEAADQLLIVTAPEPAAITDAYAVIKVLATAPPSTEEIPIARQVSLLVNMVAGRAEARTVHERIAKVCHRFLDSTVLDAGFVVSDEHVKMAVRRCRPFVLAFPRCPASYCMVALSRKLIRPTAAKPGGQGFFRRVAHLFG